MIDMGLFTKFFSKNFNLRFYFNVPIDYQKNRHKAGSLFMPLKKYCKNSGFMRLLNPEWTEMVGLDIYLFDVLNDSPENFEIIQELLENSIEKELKVKTRRGEANPLKLDWNYDEWVKSMAEGMVEQGQINVYGK